ncbi:MAG: integration host factor subunit beta [Desulfobacterales bacterium]|nr:integration host factor subunit beta [Desulfobacterales bacterium]
MTKTELIEALRKETDLTKTKAKQVVELFFDEMTEALASGDRVEIRGLCTIYVKDYNGYTGRNPKTGESRQVPPKKLPFFKCGKELKERVDYIESKNEGKRESKQFKKALRKR